MTTSGPGSGPGPSTPPSTCLLSWRPAAPCVRVLPLTRRAADCDLIRASGTSGSLWARDRPEKTEKTSCDQRAPSDMCMTLVGYWWRWVLPRIVWARLFSQLGQSKWWDTCRQTQEVNTWSLVNMTPAHEDFLTPGRRNPAGHHYQLRSSWQWRCLDHVAADRAEK